MSTLAPVDPDNYAWRQASDHSPLWQRRACGAEVPIAVLTGGRYFNSYAFTTALVDGKYSLQDLKRAARAAWRLLRYEEPHIAGTAAGVQGRPMLRYYIPKDEEEVEEWLDRTILVEASSRTPLVIRDAYEEDRRRKNLGVPEAARIYIAASVQDELTPLNSAPVRILFQVYTLFFDGIGFRCMMASFFRGLVAQLSASNAISHNELDWRKSKDNLREAYVKLLAPEQYASEPEFNASFGELFSQRSPDSRNYSLLVARCPANWGLPETLWHNFTKEQSENMITAVQTRLGPGYTITHLGQAACLLAQIRMNLGDIPASFYWSCFTAINGRRYMQEPYKSYRKPYFPYCQVNGFVVFDEITNYVQRGHRGKDAKTVELLMSAAKQSRDGFEKTTNLPHIMAIMVPIAEGICDGSYGIAQPMYTSYGIDEQYIPRHFNNDKGEQALSLADLRFWSENYAPFPAVRLTSWRKACRVTVEWNSGCFGEAFMRVFLAELADLMLFFASPELKDQQPEDRAEEA